MAGAQDEISAIVTGFIIPAVIVIANRYGPETFSHREKYTLNQVLAQDFVAEASLAASAVVGRCVSAGHKEVCYLHLDK